MSVNNGKLLVIAPDQTEKIIVSFEMEPDLETPAYTLLSTLLIHGDIDRIPIIYQGGIYSAYYNAHKRLKHLPFNVRASKFCDVAMYGTVVIALPT